MIVLESNQNHATAKDTEVVNALPASMGMGGGYVPMIVDEIGRTRTKTYRKTAHPKRGGVRDGEKRK